MKFCPDCDYTPFDQTDSYCQQCGHYLVQDSALSGLFKSSDSYALMELKLNHLILIIGIFLELIFFFIIWLFKINFILDLFSLAFFFPFIFIFGNNFIHDLRISSKQDKIFSGIFNLALVLVIISISIIVIIF